MGNEKITIAEAMKSLEKLPTNSYKKFIQECLKKTEVARKLLNEEIHRLAERSLDLDKIEKDEPASAGESSQGRACPFALDQNYMLQLDPLHVQTLFAIANYQILINYGNPYYFIMLFHIFS